MILMEDLKASLILMEDLKAKLVSTQMLPNGYKCYSYSAAVFGMVIGNC